METTKLSDLIDHAFSRRRVHTDYFKNEEIDGQRKQLIKGIKANALKHNSDSGCVINLDSTLKDISTNIDSFQSDVEEFISSLTKDKYLYALRFDLLIQYMNEKYSLSISNEFLNKFKFKDADQRRIAILKYLHEDAAGKSRQDIALAFGIDEKTLREDMNILKDGFHFMGNTMHIEGHDKAGKIYSSPVHPLFLALNTTQIWSLIMGLKLLPKGSVLEFDLSEIADMIYAQLSPFAKKIIDDKSDEYSISLSTHELEFKDSRQFMRQNLYSRLSQILRKSASCQIVFWDEQIPGAQSKVVGYPAIFIDDNYKLDRISITIADGSKIIINKENLIDIDTNYVER